MLFSTLFPVAALAAVVAAAPSALVARQSDGECTTGQIACCNTSFDSASEQTESLFGLLGLVHTGLEGLVGAGCSPSSGLLGVGDSGSSCSQQPLCCNDNYFGGLISIGCSPINIVL